MTAINSSNQKGFILVTVLWVLAIMLIAVGVFHSYVERKLAVGIQAKLHLEQQLDQYSTKQTLLYLFSGSRITRAGLTFSNLSAEELRGEDGLIMTTPVGDELLLDGTVYQGINQVNFAVQDLSGLVSVNGKGLFDIARLLEHYEPEAAKRSRLLAALQDYIDANDLITLSGAEANDYIREQLPPPTNDLLRSEYELRRVYGWSDWLNKHPDFIASGWLDVRRSSTLNLNTMPKDLLGAYFGLGNDIVGEIVNSRRQQPFFSTGDFLGKANLIEPIDEHKFRFYPGDEFRLKVWVNGGGQAEVISLQLTPNGLYGPLLINHQYSVERDKSNDEAVALAQTRLFDGALVGDR